jgi:hypothetical protein
MKTKLLLDSQMKNKLLSQNKSTIFDWENDMSIGLIARNKKMGVNLHYYAVFDEEDNYQYDTFGIEERKGNCVSIVLNQHDDICLLHEYRFMPNKLFLSCPRGFSDKNESRLQCSLREIKEEVGDFKILENIDLGNLYQNTTFFINPIGVKIVKIEVEGEIEINESKKSEDISKVMFYKLDLVKNMINEGKIECLITLGALSKYFCFIENKNIVDI